MSATRLAVEGLYRQSLYAVCGLSSIVYIMKKIYVATAAILCVSLSLVACTDKPQISPSDQGSAESSATINSDQALTLSDKAAKAGVTVALAKAWELEGVHIADNGSVYSTTCPVSRKVRIPSGISIRC